MAREQISGYVDDLESIWRCFDALYGSLDDATWRRPFGKDWRFADQPYHLEYFDRLILAEPIEAGEQLPEDQRWSVSSMNQIHAWNAREFAKRPPEETPQRSLERSHATRDRLRVILSKFDDADLDSYMVFNHLVGGGWWTLRGMLVAAITHNWGEYTEAWYRAGRTAPLPTPSATRTGVSFYLTFMTSLARAEVAKQPFTVAWDLTGPGGGSWTIRVANGRATLEDGPARDADLTMRLSPETFNIVMLRRARNPLRAMLAGEVKIRGMSKMGLMKRVFPEPEGDDEVRLAFAG